jgi:hypothetical protein
VLVTTYRPETDYPELVAYVAWFDHTRTEIGYYPGRYAAERRAGRRVGPAEPGPDRLERAAQPPAERQPRQPAVGYTLGGLTRVWRSEMPEAEMLPENAGVLSRR